MERKETLDKKEDRIFGLDVIRATAILLVLFSHLYYVLGSVHPTVISLSGLAGYAGVELFFVLSGFLIGGILLRQFLTSNFTFANFWVFIKRRWFRTLPNYYLVLMVQFILAYSFGYLTDNWWRYLLFLQNGTTYTISFFSESWSLSVEEWTYILLPLALLFGAKCKFSFSRKGQFLFMIVFLILVAHAIRYFAFLHERIYSLESWNTNWKSIVLYRFDAILIGVVLAWLVHFHRDFVSKYSGYCLIVAVHLFVLQFFVLNILQVDIVSCPIYFHVFYGTLTSVTFTTALPYFIFWNKAEGSTAFLITGISKISYSVYLLHYGIVAVLLKYIVTSYAISLPSMVLGGLYLAITFVVSYLLYRFYEMPMRNLRDKS